jgi:hypothetical protein
MGTCPGNVMADSSGYGGALGGNSESVVIPLTFLIVGKTESWQPWEITLLYPGCCAPTLPNKTLLILCPRHLFRFRSESAELLT